MSVERIRKGDTIVVIRGEDAGKTGKVLQFNPGKGTALVEGINLVRKCLRKSQDKPKGGISDKEAPVRGSNIMPYCPVCKKGVRLRAERDGDKKIRKCRKCQHVFEG